MATEAKEMKVTALKHGTVIDHIPAGEVLKVFQILGLENYNRSLRLGINLDSRKYGKKDLLKIEDRELTPEEANRLALIAPKATINIIKNWDVIQKINVSVPDVVTGIQCANPRCITRHDRTRTEFIVLDKERLKVRCSYCEHVFEREDVIQNI